MQHSAFFDDDDDEAIWWDEEAYIYWDADDGYLVEVTSDEKTKNSKLGLLYSLPINIWMVLFFLIPMLIVLSYSFLKRNTYGGVDLVFSLEAFSIFKEHIFLLILLKTVYISVLITIFTVIIAIPVSYYIARSKHKQELLMLIIIPFGLTF